METEFLRLKSTIRLTNIIIDFVNTRHIKFMNIITHAKDIKMVTRSYEYMYMKTNYYEVK
jgi:hypothetical protein